MDSSLPLVKNEESNNMLVGKISSNGQWNLYKGKEIMNETINISNMGDLHPYHNGVTFPKAKTVFLTNCDKNFTYYWLDKQTFPNVETIYLLCHPCEPIVLHRFPKSIIYLSDFYETYKIRWAPEQDYVKIMDHNLMVDEINKLKEEQLITSLLSNL